MDGLDALKISEEKKKYIVDLLNPVLEEMVAECIHRMPEDPAPFMLEWLEQKKVTDEDKLLSPEEKERLTKENKELTANVAKVKQQMQAATSLAYEAEEKKPEDKDEEEEEEDDEDDEPPPGFGEGQRNGARQSVSAEAYGEWNAAKPFVAPVVPKSDQQKERLKTVLSKSLLFGAVDPNDLAIVIGAMKEVVTKPGERIINQGEVGDFLFVIEAGKMDCLIKSGDEEKVVKTCETGDVFGELALMYNSKRAASVESKEAGVCWQLDRDTFNHIVRKAAEKKRERYDLFLSKVPILSGMDAYERSQIADALKSESYDDGQTIISEGEVGRKFYILEEGQGVVMKNGVKVSEYGVGDFFGELALITNQPRLATVKAVGSMKVLTIDKASFHRLLNVDHLMQEIKGKYSN